ncbi:hypothetical protein F7Q99_31960 [Streptomyces kaniharaensis]|uniref:Uncharacterized protein n=1 Tax=Streptomyces kaniharaensis TaxID=212423 RepID=A0A6N7KZ30_9ACTN|nr:hypothetical protein [Streptomyces kaniharaensis]MQS16681.1 hypothetical protein [Streptomyces kaniharaensis]
MKTRITLALAAVLLGIGAAGCSSSGGTTSPGPQPRPFGGVTHYDEPQRLALHNAEEGLIAGCMRGRGFDYRPQGLATGDHRADANPYGLLTVAQAANDGFGLISTALNMKHLDDPNQAQAANEAWKAALLGTEAHRVTVDLPDGQQFFYNSDSCLSQAEDSLYGPDYFRAFNTFQVLSSKVVTGVQADARFAAAEKRWHDCMAAAGEPSDHLAGPIASIDQRVRQDGSDPAKTHDLIGRELSLAKTSARCQDQAGLAATVEQIQSDVEKTVIGTNQPLLDQLRILQQQALARASHPAPTGTP